MFLNLHCGSEPLIELSLKNEDEYFTSRYTNTINSRAGHWASVLCLVCLVVTLKVILRQSQC